MKEQRLEILQKVSNGELSPEQADDKLLNLSIISNSWFFCPKCGTEWTADCNQFGCWQCGESHVC